jgi:hypothetical protein
MRSWRILLLALLSVMACLASVGPVVAAANAAVQNDSMWTDSAGMFHIFGEVKNTGDVWLQFVKITATLRDGNGGIVDVVYTFTHSMFLPPQGISPFDLAEIDTAKASRVQTYSLIVEYQEAPSIPQKLVILNIADSKSSLGWLEIVGEVENQAEQVSTYTKIVGTFYNETGKVIYATFTFTSPSDVPAGARHPFKMTVLSDERTSKVARYTLLAESMNSQYTSVPEWPLPQIMLVGAVGVACLLIGRRGRSCERA